MPQATTPPQSSERERRAVISLDKDTEGKVDKLIGRAAKALTEAGIPGVKVSRADMVRTLVNQALDAQNGQNA